MLRGASRPSCSNESTAATARVPLARGHDFVARDLELFRVETRSNEERPRAVENLDDDHGLFALAKIRHVALVHAPRFAGRVLSLCPDRVWMTRATRLTNERDRNPFVRNLTSRRVLPHPPVHDDADAAAPASGGFKYRGAAGFST